MTLKRLIVLVLAVVLVGAPVAQAQAGADSGASAAAAKKKGKKCKKKGKRGGKKKGKKCKKRRGASGGSQGLPGKPVNPNPPDPPVEPDPLLIESLTLAENPLLAGSSGSGQVTLSAPAPAGGQPVTLGSADITRATVPDSVHVAAGQTSASFAVSTTVGPPTSVALTAAIEGSVENVQLDIVDEADLDSVALDYQCFPDTGQTYNSNVVRLNVRAPSDTLVNLASSDPLSLAVPSTVIVPQSSFTGAFSVNTLLTTPAVTVTASYDGVDRTDTASIRDSGSPAPVVSGLVLSPASVVVGDPSTGTVSLDCEAPPGGIVVGLSDNHPLVTLPSTVTIPEGELSAGFTINTDVSGSAGQAVISATTGSTTVQQTLELRDIGT